MKNESWWNWIQRGLADANKTMSDLAEEIGVQRSSVYGWRERNTPTPESVRAVAHALGKPPAEGFLVMGWLYEDELDNITITSGTEALTKEQLLAELAVRIPGPDVTISERPEPEPALKRAPSRVKAKAKTPAKKALRSSAEKPKRG